MFEITTLRPLLVAAVAALAILACAAPVGAHGSAEPTGYTDASGDANGSPDIQGVTVSDDASGKLVFRIQTDQPARPPDAGLFVFVNADRNLATGGYNDGIEYVFGIDATGFGIVRVTAAGPTAVKAPGASGSWQDGVVTLTVNRRDLAGTNAFTFFVASALASSPGTMRDDAPNHGLWTYTMATAAPVATAIQLSASKVIALPRMGRLYAVALLVRRSDTGGLLGKEGRLECTAKLGPTPLQDMLSTFMTQTYEGEKIPAGFCSWLLPVGSAGKTIRGTITATYKGATVSRSFALKVA